MALNLSRNTKVFVSSVNGVPVAGGGMLNVYISVKGTGYAIGDIVTLGTNTVGSGGANAKCIVLSHTGGAVDTIAIPSNFRGNGYEAEDVVTASAVETFSGGSSSGADLAVTVVDATGTTTAEGSRTATGRFKGNETTANCFRIGVLDGYSFSQGSESTDVTITEAGATPNRGSKRFNDSLPPAEWSFGTYVRPFIHGASSWRSNTLHDMCENILWSALAGTGLADASGGAVDTNAGDPKGANVVFANSNVHELMKINIYFVLENTTYRLNDAQIGTAEIDFSIDGIAQIMWSGSATTIDQVTVASEDPSKYLTLGITDVSTMTGESGGTQLSSSDITDGYAESYNYCDSTGPADADYLRNKLSALFLDSDTQGGGASSQGLDGKTYAINITGGNITIENNITYVTPETIGVVDKPIGSFTGSRTITGSLTMYLDTKALGSNQLLSDLAGSTDLVSNAFDMSLLMGSSYASSKPAAGRYTAAMIADSNSIDDAHGTADFTGPAVEFFMPNVHLTVPAIEVGDLISVSLEFSAQGQSLLTTDEMSVKYLASTTHSDATAGYDYRNDDEVSIVSGGA